MILRTPNIVKWILLSIFSLLAICCTIAQPEKKPDILFIAIDDMNDWTTLFDKNNPIKTPNLERLAARGMLFSRAYCVVPACGPSRAALLMGYRPETTGLFENTVPTVKLETLPDAVSLPQYFRNNGYTAKGTGKVFHHTGRDRGDDPRGTEQSWDHFRKMGRTTSPHLNGFTKPDGITKPVGKDRLAGMAFDWGEISDDVRQGDEDVFDYVAQRMEEKRDKPMFLAAGIFRPHLPFYASKEFFDMYPLDQVVMPPMPANDLDDVPAIGRKMAAKEDFIYEETTRYQPPDVRSLERMVQSYQAASSYTDSMVGRLLDKLDASGRADNTIIVLWSDHGYHLGDKTSAVKFTLWEKATRVPFIIVAPGVTKPGSRCETPVSLLDIYPTLLELAGLPPKGDNDGVSLVSLLKDPKAEWTRPAIMTMGEGNHAVRSERWRYIRYSDGTEELYDHSKDPWEWTNQAGNPKHKDVIAAHRKWLPSY